MITDPSVLSVISEVFAACALKAERVKIAATVERDGTRFYADIVPRRAVDSFFIEAAGAFFKGEFSKPNVPEYLVAYNAGAAFGAFIAGLVAQFNDVAERTALAWFASVERDARKNGRAARDVRDKFEPLAAGLRPAVEALLKTSEQRS